MSEYKIPNLNIQIDHKYLPVYARNMVFFYYHNSDDLLTNTDFDDWQVALYNHAGFVADLVQPTKDIISGSGFRFYFEFEITQSVTGVYFFGIYNKVTNVAIMQGSPFLIIEQSDIPDHTFFRYRHSVNRDNYNYELLAQYNSVFLHVDQIGDGNFEYDKKGYRELSTGRFRNKRSQTHKRIDLETYLFDAGANDSMGSLSDHDTILINEEAVTVKEGHEHENNRDFDLSKGSFSFYIDKFSNINLNGQFNAFESWDLQTLNFIGNEAVGAEDNLPRSPRFSSDGLRMYWVGDQNDKIYQATLGTAWKPSTRTVTVNISVATEDNKVKSMWLRPDESQVFILGEQNSKIYQYTMSTPGLLSSLAYDSKFISVSAETSVPAGLTINNTGEKVYVIDSGSNKIFRYTMTTAWDASTGSYDTQFFDATAIDITPTDLFLRDDNKTMFFVGQENDSVYELLFSVLQDVSTSVLQDTKSIATNSINPTGVFFRGDGLRMFTATLAQDITEFNIG